AFAAFLGIGDHRIPVDHVRHARGTVGIPLQPRTHVIAVDHVEQSALGVDNRIRAVFLAGTEVAGLQFVHGDLAGHAENVRYQHVPDGDVFGAIDLVRPEDVPA